MGSSTPISRRHGSTCAVAVNEVFGDELGLLGAERIRNISRCEVIRLPWLARQRLLLMPVLFLR